MPVIKVWCLPPNQTEDQLNRLHNAIVDAVVGIKELGLKDEKDLTNLFVPDLMQYGLGSEIIIEITGLLEKPEMTKEIRKKLGKVVTKAVKELYPDVEKVECFIFSPFSLDGLWTSETSKESNDPEGTRKGSILNLRKDIKPRDIEPESVFGKFGKHEVEQAAKNLLEFFQVSDRWDPFSFENLCYYYRQADLDPSMILFGLICSWVDNSGFGSIRRLEEDLIVMNSDGTLSITDEFIRRITTSRK